MGDDVLAFEEFIRRDPSPRYNNLYLHFITTSMCYLYRNTPHFQRFQKEHPGLEARLTTGIMNRDKSLFTSDSLKPFEDDLYEAYKIMRSYGVTDIELFG